MHNVNDAPVELADAIREFFPEAEWDHAASISYLESGWNWDSEFDSTAGGTFACGEPLYTRGGVLVTAEHSVSYFQINACNYPDWEWAHFFNVRQNVGTAHALWAARGWSPWYFSAQQLGLL